jgi:phenylpropionate dioxygenase-like ring-hydroxylating dioxygenase large terminal subunit
MQFLKNAWYQAGWSDELHEGCLLARRILDQPVVLFRVAGHVHALVDRCAHRFAPLSRGRLEGNTVRCGYHGLGFDVSGQCVFNPHGPVPKAVRVNEFTVFEKHRAIWIWMGASELADPNAIVDLSFINRTPIKAEVRGYMPTRANYQLLSDNILDLSHTNYLHAESIGGLSQNTKMSVQEPHGRVFVRWTDFGAQPNNIQKAMMPGVEHVDNWVEVTWHAPAVMTLDAGAVPAGSEVAYEDHGVALHSMTPETFGTTHYFFFFARRRDLDNETLTAESRAMFSRAFFEEDKPMIEAQQERIETDSLWDMRPALLSIDAASVKARRRLERLVAQEAEKRAPSVI